MRVFPDAICWHEGMPLLPQHFQLQALRAEGVAAHYAAACQPHFWGVLSLEIDESALVGGVIRITELDALLPDGLPVRYTSGVDAPLQLDVSEAIASSPDKTITVQLAVPPLYRGGRLDPTTGRFRSATSDAVPDMASGESPTALPVWRPDARLVADDANVDFIRLPLLRIRQQGGGLARAAYSPPSPVVLPESLLGRKLASICTAVREKCIFLSGRLHSANRAGDHESVEEITRLLSALWQRLPEMEAALHTRSTPPASFYVALAGLAGSLSALNPAGGVPPFRVFDYQDTLACFDEIGAWISAALARVREGYRILPFSRDAAGFWIDLPPVPVSSDGLIIGLRMPAGNGERAAQTWLSKAIVASDSHLPALVQQRMGGLPRRSLERDERAAFSVGEDTELFNLNTNVEWFDATQRLRVAVPSGGNLVDPWEIMLFVPDEPPQGERTHD